MMYQPSHSLALPCISCLWIHTCYSYVCSTFEKVCCLVFAFIYFCATEETVVLHASKQAGIWNWGMHWRD